MEIILASFNNTVIHVLKELATGFIQPGCQKIQGVFKELRNSIQISSQFFGKPQAISAFLPTSYHGVL